MLARVGEKLDSEFVSLGHSGPQHLRIVGGPQAVRLDRRSRRARTPRSPCSAPPAQQGPHHAAQPGPHRGGQPDHRGAHLDRRPRPLAARQQRPRDRPPGAPRPRAASTSTPPAAPAPSSCSSARCCTSSPAFQLPVRRRLRPRHPHRRAAPVRAASAFGLDVAATHGFYEATVDAGRRARPAPSCSPSAATPSPRTCCSPRPATPGTTVIRNASPNYMVQDLCFFLQALGVQIDGIGTTTLTVTGVRRHRRGRRVLPVRGPDRGDEPASPPPSSPSPTITIERVPIEFLEIELATLEEHGHEVRHHRGVPRGERPHPPASTSRSIPGPLQGAGRQDRTRCRSPA